MIDHRVLTPLTQYDLAAHFLAKLFWWLPRIIVAVMIFLSFLVLPVLA
jgi:hypothetical protein